jgi:hypothetical protein
LSRPIQQNKTDALSTSSLESLFVAFDLLFSFFGLISVAAGDAAAAADCFFLDFDLTLLVVSFKTGLSATVVCELLFKI